MGAALAIEYNWPGAHTLFGVGLYQLAYCLLVAVAFAAVVGMVHVRAERLAREEREKGAI